MEDDCRRKIALQTVSSEPAATTLFVAAGTSGTAKRLCSNAVPGIGPIGFWTLRTGRPPGTHDVDAADSSFTPSVSTQNFCTSTLVTLRCVFEPQLCGERRCCSIGNRG
jgi:hypothetical protein